MHRLPCKLQVTWGIQEIPPILSSVSSRLSEREDGWPVTCLFEFVLDRVEY
jgi:hypothetical protein